MSETRFIHNGEVFYVPDLDEIGGHWDNRILFSHGGDPVSSWRRIARIPGVEWEFDPESCQEFLATWFASSAQRTNRNAHRDMRG